MSKKVVIKRYEVIDLVIDNRAREWCLLPYPDHPKGCPNYNQKAECPPLAPVIKDFIDLKKKKWFLVAKFNLQAQEDRMIVKHPDWSKRQARCVLYWQGSVRKQLTDACKELILNTNLVFTLIPEAMGVQVIKTAKKLKIPIETRPKVFVHKIALIGYSKKAIKKNLFDYLNEKKGGEKT
jgi:predicted metal-binding protein